LTLPVSVRLRSGIRSGILRIPKFTLMPGKVFTKCSPRLINRPYAHFQLSEGGSCLPVFFTLQFIGCGSDRYAGKNVHEMFSPAHKASVRPFSAFRRRIMFTRFFYITVYRLRIGPLMCGKRSPLSVQEEFSAGTGQPGCRPRIWEVSHAGPS